MTALALLPILAVLMLADFMLTIEGLRSGLDESNKVARFFMARLGLMPGLAAFSLMWFAIMAALALAFPSQWLVILWACADAGFGVGRNISLLRSL